MVPIVHTDGDNVKTYGKLTGIDSAISNTQQYDIITITWLRWIYLSLQWYRYICICRYLICVWITLPPPTPPPPPPTHTHTHTLGCSIWRTLFVRLFTDSEHSVRVPACHPYMSQGTHRVQMTDIYDIRITKFPSVLLNTFSIFSSVYTWYMVAVYIDQPLQIISRLHLCGCEENFREV